MRICLRSIILCVCTKKIWEGALLRFMIPYMICRWEVVTHGFSMQHRPHLCSLAIWFDKNLVCKSRQWMPVTSNHHWHVFAAESGNIFKTVRVLWSVCCWCSSFAIKALLHSFWGKGLVSELNWMWLDEDECRYLSFTVCWFIFCFGRPLWWLVLTWLLLTLDIIDHSSYVWADRGCPWLWGLKPATQMSHWIHIAMAAPLPPFVDTELPRGHPFGIQPESESDDIEELNPAHPLQGSVEIFDLTEDHSFELRKTAETYDPFADFQIIETDDPEPEPEMTDVPEIPEIPLSGRRNRLSIPIPENSRLYETGFSEEVRRCSVSSNSVLQFLGAVLGNGNDEKKHESIAKAFDEEQWDFFISHNWSVKRWKKFLALCLVWSGKKALICCCLSQLLCFVLISIGILPTTTSHTDGHEISIWCMGACLVAYLVVFMLVPDLSSCLGFRGYRTFLDKVCVDQSDEARKKEGIQAITAFLYHSDTLLVLFSDVYLRRLWTVFELTTFLALKPDANIVVQPVLLGPVVLYFVILRSLRIGEIFLMPSTLENRPSLESPTLCGIVILITVDLLGTLLGAIFLRMWGRTRSNMTQQISEFAFESAECHDEADRMEILGSIKALARQEGFWVMLFAFYFCPPPVRCGKVPSI